VYGQQNEGTDCEESQEEIEPTAISFVDLDEREKAFEYSVGVEKIGEDPNVVVEDGEKDVDKQSYYDDSDQDN